MKSKVLASNDETMVKIVLTDIDIIDSVIFLDELVDVFRTLSELHVALEDYDSAKNYLSNAMAMQEARDNALEVISKNAKSAKSKESDR